MVKVPALHQRVFEEIRLRIEKLDSGMTGEQWLRKPGEEGHWGRFKEAGPCRRTKVPIFTHLNNPGGGNNASV